MNALFTDWHYRDMVATLMRALSLFDLSRVARLNRATWAAATREMLARIGPRNFELVAALDPLTLAPIAEVDHRTTVSYSDMRNFAEMVTDPAAYWPLVIALRRRYIPRYEWHRYKGGCEPLSLATIASYWIHRGLAGCARLIIGNDYDAFDEMILGSCEKVMLEQQRDKFINDPELDIATLSQEHLFWYNLTWGRQSKNICAVIFLLDEHHYNLLIEMALCDADGAGYLWKYIQAANVAWPRYDPYFVRRTIDRFVVPGGFSDVQRQYGADPATPALSIFRALPDRFEPDMSVSGGDPPLDVYRHCPTCAPVETHLHLPHHEWRHIIISCECECHACVCGDCLGIVIECRDESLCSKCRCCFCALECVCQCDCDSICSGTCSCCICRDGCKCYDSSTRIGYTRYTY